MNSDLFGRLVMPVEKAGEEIASSSIQLWSDSPLNRGLLIASIVIVLLCMRDHYFVGGDIFKSFWRWKWSFKIESNMAMARSRDICALTMVIPFIIIVSFNFFPQKSILYPALLFASYSVPKKLIHMMLEGKTDREETLKTAFNSGKNHFALLTVFASVLSIIFGIIGLSEVISRNVILITAIAFLSISLIRKFEILRSSYHGFTTFLYLCALEIPPLAISGWFYFYYGQ